MAIIVFLMAWIMLMFLNEFGQYAAILIMPHHSRKSWIDRQERNGFAA